MKIILFCCIFFRSKKRDYCTGQGKKGKVGVSRKERGRGRGVRGRLAMHHSGRSPDCGFVFTDLRTHQSKTQQSPSSPSSSFSSTRCQLIRLPLIRWVLFILFSVSLRSICFSCLQPSPVSICCVFSTWLCQHLLLLGAHVRVWSSFAPRLSNHCKILRLCKGTFQKKKKKTFLLFG